MKRGARYLILALASGAVVTAGGAALVSSEGWGLRSGEASGPEATAAAAGAPLPQAEDGPAYNGQFTYVRLRYGQSGSDLRNLGSGWGRRGRGRGAPWSHDWPRAEVNFAKIVDATTFIDTYSDGYAGRVLDLDDPELFKYPVATIIEVGWWAPSDEEIQALREYLLKGGFLIVDDNRDDRGHEWRNFQAQMRRALPEYQIMPVPEDHEIFNSFFFIEDPLSLVPPYGWYPATYHGIFEDNDPENGRLMVMINWNQDLQEYWEFSDRGYYPIDLSNEAYQFGVNYLVYALTH